MTLICVGSVKGAPGATTAALGLAAAWPGPKVLIEFDPAGGSLAIRYQRPPTPGLLTLAAHSASGLELSHLWASAQELPGGLGVVLAPDRPDQVMAALRSTAVATGRWLAAQDDLTAIVDVGRIGQEPALHGLLNEADAVVLVARPVADQLQPGSHLFERLGQGAKAGWLLIGDSPYSAADVVAAYGRPVIGVLPDDRKAANLLDSGGSGSRLRRSLLAREVSELAARLARSVASTPVDAR